MSHDPAGTTVGPSLPCAGPALANAIFAKSRYFQGLLSLRATMRVISCSAAEHNLGLVLLAAMVCAVGCLVSVRLLERARRTEGMQRLGWGVQTALGARPPGRGH